MRPQTKNPSVQAGASFALNALDSFQHAHGGKFRRASQGGYSTNCPHCQRDKRNGTALTITAGTDGRLLAHCFKSDCRFADIIAAVGLTWKDVMPFRNVPETAQEREAQRRRMREVAIENAAVYLSLHGEVIRIAGRQIIAGTFLDAEDLATLIKAVDGVDGARRILQRGYFDGVRVN